MTRLLTHLNDLHDAGKCLLLASGGLDSTYCMQWAAKHRIDLACLHVDVGNEAFAQVEGFASQFGLEARCVDARDRFADGFVAPAIRAGVLYQGVYPLSSSLSRPLMAEIAVEEARAMGADTIVHTAAAHQNSFHRFNLSLASCGPEFSIASPFLESHIDRSDKRTALERDGIHLEETVHSIDANLWCRVVENGSLDDSTAPVPDSVFVWTATPEYCEQVVEIEFEGGLPTHIDGRRLTLARLLFELNALSGRHGIGRFNGFEQTPWGSKNHEVREAPAASVILTAARHLRQVSLPDEALSLLDACAGQWLHQVVVGRWFAAQTRVLQQAIQAFAEPVSGGTSIKLQGEAFVAALRPKHSLAFDRHPADLDAPLSYDRLLVAELDAPTIGQIR